MKCLLVQYWTRAKVCRPHSNRTGTKYWIKIIRSTWRWLWQASLHTPRAPRLTWAYGRQHLRRRRIWRSFSTSIISIPTWMLPDLLGTKWARLLSRVASSRQASTHSHPSERVWASNLTSLPKQRLSISWKTGSHFRVSRWNIGCM